MKNSDNWPSLREYLDKYANKDLEERAMKEFEHNALIEDFLRGLKMMNKFSSSSIYREVPLYEGKSERRMRGKTDIVILTGDEISVVEAKIMRGSNYKASKNILRRQLLNDYGFFSSRFGVDPQLFGLYRGLKIDGFSIQDYSPFMALEKT